MVRSIDLEALTLERGSHKSIEQGACVMEAVSYVNGEEFSDRPECAGEVLGTYLRHVNDSLDDEKRQELKPYITRLVGAKPSRRVEHTRAWLATDWLVRECAPAFLRSADLTLYAKLEDLMVIDSDERARGAFTAIEAAEHAAQDVAEALAWAGDLPPEDYEMANNVVGEAMFDALVDSAFHASMFMSEPNWGTAVRASIGAEAASRAAMKVIAWKAAMRAAKRAGGHAVKGTVKIAARDALEPTVKRVRASALNLIDPMIVVE